MGSLIVNVIQRYHPEWYPPADNGYEWVSCLCPWHGDRFKSASVSFTKNAFHCFACPVKGDAIAIIRYEERNSFAEAKSIAEGLSEGGNVAVSRGTTRQPRQRLFADERFGLGINSDGGEQVPTRIRW